MATPIAMPKLGIAIGVLCLGGIGMFIIREWRTAR